MSNEKKDRRTKRTLLQKELVIKSMIKAEALDISTDGLYIYTQSSFIPGAIFEVEFEINDSPIRAMVRVQHAQPNVGVGVKFVNISENDLIKVRQYVEG